MVYIPLASIFDGDGDDTQCIITTTRSFARLVVSLSSDEITYQDSDGWPVEPDEAQQDLIASGITAVLTSLE